MDVRVWNRRNSALSAYFESSLVARRLVLLVTTQTIDSAQELQSASFILRPVHPEPLYGALCDICLQHKLTRIARTWLALLSAATDGKLADRHPLRILLTEDNAVNQKVVTRMLQRLGYAADIAPNGVDALTTLRHKPYDVVLMDVHMPEMDGITATRIMHEEWEEDTRPRIIALTADALEGDREHFLEQGFDDYLSKPVRISDLVEKLLKCQQLDVGLDYSPLNESKPVVANWRHSPLKVIPA